MVELGENYFGIVDYILLGSTLLISLLIGLYYGYVSKNTNEELLMGGRNMSIFPVAASVMVTYVSGISIIGFPSEVYSNGSQILVMHLAYSVGITISAFSIMPFFYRMKLTSINEYAEKRFESVWVRWLTSALLILQQIASASVALYVPSIPLETFLGIPPWISLLGVGVCATIYTNIGGLKAVVLTDAFQFFIMIAGMVAIVWRGLSASGGIVNSFELVKERGRLHLFDFSVDPFMRHNFRNFMIGMGFHSMMQTGIHQLQVQRYSGMSSISKAKQAIIGSIPLKIIIMSLCLLTGFAIFAFYANCDPLTNGDIAKIDQILPYFVVHELSNIPGMMGLFTSCIFSAVLSSLSSSLNSLAAVTWEDFLVRIKYFRSLTSMGQTNVTRLVGVVYGIICIGLAFSAQNLGTIYSVSYAVTAPMYGALHGVFLAGMFLPFVNAIEAITGALTGLVAVWVVCIGAIMNKSTKLTTLPLSVEQCPAINMTLATTPITMLASAPHVSSISLDEWPWKIFSLSYLLYHLTGALICIIVAVLVSLLVRLCCPSYRKRRPPVSLVHPLVRGICYRFVDSSQPAEYNSFDNKVKDLANGSSQNDGIPMSSIVTEVSTDKPTKPFKRKSQRRDS